MNRSEIIEAMAGVRYFFVDPKTTREELDVMFNEKREHKYGTNYIVFLPYPVEQVYDFEAALENKDEKALDDAIYLLENAKNCSTVEMKLLDMSKALDYSSLDISLNISLDYADTHRYSFRDVSESTVKDIIMSEIPKLTK